MNRFCLVVVFISVSLLKSYCQTTFPVNGAADKNHNFYVFKNCSLHVDYQTVVPNATLVVKDGYITEAGEKIIEPSNAVVFDLKGKHIYPAFIDIYSDYGMPEVKFTPRAGLGPQMESTQKGAYNWNMAVRPETDAFKLFFHDQRAADEMRKLGFGSVLTSQKDGIVRGSAVLVALSSAKENESIIKDRAAALYSFRKGASPQDYPESLTGAIALLRQTYLDAQWYASLTNKTEYNIALEAFNNLQTLPQIFETTDKLSALRADKIGDEFKVKYLIKGSGNEYQRISDMFETFSRFILPLNFPDAFDVEDPFDAEQISLTELKHWELAASNPVAFQKMGIQFAFTTSGMKDRKSLFKNVRKAMEFGLSEQVALKAFTHNPAEFLGVQDKIGSLKKGMYANFFITNKNVFEEGAIIYENWVNGIQHKYADMNLADISGKYKLKIDDKENAFTIKQSEEKYTASIVLKDTTKTNVTFSFKNNLVTFYYATDSVNTSRLAGTYNDSVRSFAGKGQTGGGTWFEWSMTRSEDVKKDEPKKTAGKKAAEVGEVIYPFVAYGKKWEDENLKTRFKNRLGAILIKDATVWTNETDGVLKDYDVYVVEGKIVRISENIDAPKLAFAQVVNGKGMHLTAGIIDEHSHIALSEGVNEGTQASTAEVRMGDVINSEDINIYRQLSGGVTASQLLHGSANPVGGQSALIKLRWGLNPEQMKIEKADGFIKFALGENVKQSNWGDFSNVRFPQTRMGVEQAYYDFFIRAKEYDSKMRTYNALSDKEKKVSLAPRRDLDLEALAEILNKKRFITCHSYVQSEINMLMHVGDSMGFKVNTFTHILEGYKVADKMKAHGANASTFADWWAYKMEVMDAIPYNAAILTKAGVTTAVNSDDAEMGRRLNQEAAKAIKYGGLTEEEALKLCTLNPAKMLHLDDRMGSIKVGKDADLVLWTDNPLSIYAKVDKTIIDGIVYYDAKEDSAMRHEIRKERARLINKMIQAKKAGEPTQKPRRQRQVEYHCETIGILEEQE